MSPEEHKAKLAKSGVRVIDFAVDRVGRKCSSSDRLAVLMEYTERADRRSSKEQAQLIEHVESVMQPASESKRSRLLSKVSLSSVSSKA